MEATRTQNSKISTENKAVSNLPTVITWVRIALAPVIVLLMFFKPNYWGLTSATLFIIGSITDWLDGYLARKMNAVSTWGKFLDPIADKVLVSTTLIMLVTLKLLDPFSVLILLNRDILIGGIRSLAASQNLIISAGSFGKWKTALQMIAIPAILLATLPPLEFLRPLGILLIWVSVALSLISGWQYYQLYNKGSRSKP